MISDACHEFVSELDRYLDSDDWAGFYGSDDDPFVKRVRRLRDEADDIRRILDAPPPLRPKHPAARERARRRALGLRSAS